MSSCLHWIWVYLHWILKYYHFCSSFDDFLMDMKQNKRKSIRQERKKVSKLQYGCAPLEYSLKAFFFVLVINIDFFNLPGVVGLWSQVSTLQPHLNSWCLVDYMSLRFYFLEYYCDLLNPCYIIFLSDSHTKSSDETTSRSWNKGTMYCCNSRLLLKIQEHQHNSYLQL